MGFTAPPGVFDIIPQDSQEPWKSSFLWNYVEKVIREIALEYGFQEIRTPLFEKTELLARGVGESSDIVTKEMYTFEDKGGRSLTLRPEGTAPVIRAFIEAQMNQTAPIHKLFYICPMFRYERAQAGRYRQHHQFGGEVIGSPDPETDAELIDMLYTLYKRLGIQNLTVSLNSIGNSDCRARYREALKSYLSQHLEALSADSQARFHKNPLRILDSKDLKDQEIVAKAPSILDFLDEASQNHFQRVKDTLDLLKIPYQVNPLLVRGLDYYNQTVYEIISSNLGAQNSIGGGGRYDGLIKSLGGQDLPSTGFGTGIERILQTMIAQNVPLPEPPKPSLFLIPLGEQAKKICMGMQKELRESHIAVQMDYSGRKLGKLMSYASQIGAQYVAIIGDAELAKEEVSLKEMATGNTLQVPFKSLKRILQVEANTNAFVDLWQEMSTPFDNRAESDFFLQKINQNIDATAKATKNLQNALQQMLTLLDTKDV